LSSVAKRRSSRSRQSASRHLDFGYHGAVNAGTTALAVIRNLSGHQGVTIATNNLRIPAEAPEGAIRSLYVFGGGVNLTAQATIGPIAFPSAPGADGLEIQCDLAIIVVGGVSITSGYSTSNLHEAAMMNEMLNRATRLGSRIGPS